MNKVAKNGPMFALWDMHHHRYYVGVDGLTFHAADKNADGIIDEVTIGGKAVRPGSSLFMRIQHQVKRFRTKLNKRALLRARAKLCGAKVKYEPNGFGARFVEKNGVRVVDENGDGKADALYFQVKGVGVRITTRLWDTKGNMTGHIDTSSKGARVYLKLFDRFFPAPKPMTTKDVLNKKLSL